MMASRLPAKYNLLLFLVASLLYPVVGVVVGEPFADPGVAELLVVPIGLVLFANLGHAARENRGGAGVVDERDVRNIDLAFVVTAVALLGSMLVIYVRYAIAGGAVPVEVDYLALIGVAAVFAVLGGTELYQRV